MHKNKTGLLFLLFVFLANVCQAQVTIKGTVTDAKTGESLPGVNVFLSNTIIEASTNTEGFYQINNVSPGICEVVFSAIGFKEKVKSIEIKRSSTRSR